MNHYDEFAISNTTREERKALLEKGIAISRCSGNHPTLSPKIKALYQEYIDGHTELCDLQNKILAMYTQPVLK